MKRTHTTFLAGIIAAALIGATLPAAAFDLTCGMPTGSIMGNYQNLMRQFGGSYGAVPDYGMGCQPSLTIGMPTTTIGDWYGHYHNQLMGLWAATGYGSLAGLGQMNGAYQNANGARNFWADRWAHEGIRGDEPITLDIQNRQVTYPDDYGW